VDAGVALALSPGEINREAVADAARKLLNAPEITARVNSVQAELAGMPAAEKVLERISMLVGD
jgi:hypothetical protein